MTVADILSHRRTWAHQDLDRLATNLSHYLDAFGFGQPTGLDLPGESSGYRSGEELHRHEHGSIPIRTASQCADADARRHSTIANHGMAPAPAGDSDVDADGKRRDARCRTAPGDLAGHGRRVTGMLKSWCRMRWHRRKAQIPGYPVAGQTAPPARRRTTPASTTPRSRGSPPPTTPAWRRSW